jgi:hypothetical protein
VSERSAEKLRDEGLAFWGKIVAAQSHEVTNAFSVINEMAGLQLDILRASGVEQPVDVLDLENICEKIRLHVRRGETSVRSINWIAHTVDLPAVEFDLKETLSKLTIAAEHWSRLKNVELLPDFPDTSARLETSLLFFSYSIFLCIEALASPGAGRQTMSLGYSNVDGGAEIAVTSSDSKPFAQESEITISSLKDLMNELEGELRMIPSQGAGDSIVFFVPAKRRNAEQIIAGTKED